MLTRGRLHIVVVVAALSLAAKAYAQLPLPTTLEDFFQGGSQPDGQYDQILHSNNCGLCHGGQDETILIHKPWQGSMMAQAARDPLFYACLAIANQDAAFAGDLCIRCHVPRAWISGRSEPPDGSAINSSDLDGITCHFCHRMVDPIYEAGVNPVEDEAILDELEVVPTTIGGGNYVLERIDRRRGPRNDFSPPHSFLQSNFYRDKDYCATCHDVSNPVYERQSDGTYALTNYDERHPTDNKYDQFPLERTYSEWLYSDYAEGGVDTQGRFGGNNPVVSTCQDCHLPDSDSKACNFVDSPVRSDMAAHDLSGGNAWVPDVIANLYAGDDDVDPVALEAGKQRAISMLQRAATLEVTQSGDAIIVRVINETGHKLPSGYPEGRRLWLNVQFKDGGGALLAEQGAYDSETADLITTDTKVYEAKLGLDAAVAAATGLPEGPSFHFALANKIYKDNRIPPRGFTNAAYEEVQAAPVAAGYSDGQYWSDTLFQAPAGAAEVVVTLYYQTASKEYITFLRDANTTTDDGQVLYEQWELTGKSPPVAMATQTVTLGAYSIGDFDADTLVTLADHADFVGCLTGPQHGPPAPGCEPGDVDADTDVDLEDFSRLQTRFDEGS